MQFIWNLKLNLIIFCTKNIFRTNVSFFSHCQSSYSCLNLTPLVEPTLLHINKYTVGTESIQTPLKFSLFVILQPFAKII